MAEQNNSENSPLMAGAPPLLRRQTTLLHFQTHHSKVTDACILFWLFPSVAALAIGYTYDASTSPCEISKDGTNYIIDLREFLLCAGGIHLAHFILHTTIKCLLSLLDKHETRNKYKAGTSGVIVIFLLFDCVWSIIGLVMYSTEMSNDCQNEDVAKMILAWCIIQSSLIGLGCCCATCGCSRDTLATVSAI
eukprot:276508_1